MHRSLLWFPWQSGPVQIGPSAGGCGRKGSWHRSWQCHSQRTVCLSDRPTSPSEHNHTVMSEPSFAMAASHDSTECGNLHAPSLCVCVVYQLELALHHPLWCCDSGSACYCFDTHLPDEKGKGHHARNVVTGNGEKHVFSKSLAANAGEQNPNIMAVSQFH